MAFWHGHATIPNEHFYCADCNRDMWDQSRRRRNPNGCPTIWVALDKKIRCTRCYDKNQEKVWAVNPSKI